MTQPEPEKVGGFGGWLQRVLAPLVRAAVDEAVTDLHDEIKADMTDMENRLLAQFTQLPGLVASQVEHVALDAEQVAENVVGRMGGIMPGMLSNVLNPSALAQQIIQGVLGGIHIPNIFGGAVHETSSGTSGAADDAVFNKPATESQFRAASRPKSKAEQIREKLEKKQKGEE